MEKKDFLKLLDFSREEILNLLDLAEKLKREKKNCIEHKVCSGKNIAMIFEKTSTRTRCAFEVAAHDLGINAVYLDSSLSQIGNKESIADTAKVISRMFDGIMYRGYEHEKVEVLAKYSSVPVWNGLTDKFHPTQVLADLLTIREYFGLKRNLKLVYMGDGRYNMANSLMVGCAKMGLKFVICAPRKYFPDIDLIAKCEEIAKNSGGSIELIENPVEATKNANIIYTDVWVSMGENQELWENRIKDLMLYQVNDNIMKNASDDCVFMHCLPAFHDTETRIGKEIYERFGISELEVTDSVFLSNASIVFDQAENRLHSIKAVMLDSLR